MRLLAKPIFLGLWVLSLLIFVTVAILAYLWHREGSLDSCKIVKKRLVSALVRPYSGTEREPNLLEPVALAIT